MMICLLVFKSMLFSSLISCCLGGNCANAGTSIRARQYLSHNAIYSKNGRCELCMQGDGNLVLYEGRTVRFATGTVTGGNNIFLVQEDGNLVVYEIKPVWSSNTVGIGGSKNRLIVTDTCRAKLEDASGNTLKFLN